jgi:hypothetical protein
LAISSVAQYWLPPSTGLYFFAIAMHKERKQ